MCYVIIKSQTHCCCYFGALLVVSATVVVVSYSCCCSRLAWVLNIVINAHQHRAAACVLVIIMEHENRVGLVAFPTAPHPLCHAGEGAAKWDLEWETGECVRVRGCISMRIPMPACLDI